MNGRLKIALAFALTVVPVLAGFPAASADEACEELVFLELVGPVCEVAPGLYEVFGPDGASLGFTHGNDPAPGDPQSHLDGSTPPPPFLPPECVSVGAQYSMLTIYARPQAFNPRASLQPNEVRKMIPQANGYVAASAGKLGVGLNLRVQCSGGIPFVAIAVLPTPASSATFSNVVSDLKTQGFNDPTVKYWVWYDKGVGSSCGGGVGSVYGDDRPTADNWNNGNGVPLFAVTWSCEGLQGAQVMAHENGHNMGAVQNSAPHGTGGLHCTDGNDIMRYNDGGPNGGAFTTTICPVEHIYDCNNDDYFHPNPPANSYLATHWNLASTNNRFVTRSSCALQASGTLLAGIPQSMNSIGFFGVNVVRQTVPSSCWGRPFTLTGVGEGIQDFDVCMETAANVRLQCWANVAAPESGIIPSGTDHAGIFYSIGAQGQWRLGAS